MLSALLRKFLNILFSSGSDDPKLEEIFKSGNQIRDLPDYEIAFTDVNAELASLGIEYMRKPHFVNDYTYNYTDEDGWNKIVPYLTFPADWYINDRAKCNTYAMLAVCKALFVYGLNVFETWGMTPMGYHAFCMVRLSDGRFKLFESNAGFEYAGELFNIGEHGYVPNGWE